MKRDEKDNDRGQIGQPASKEETMKHITILALDGTIASTVTGPTDIFSLAGVLWNQICGVQPEPYFKVFIASVQQVYVRAPFCWQKPGF